MTSDTHSLSNFQLRALCTIYLGLELLRSLSKLPKDSQELSYKVCTTPSTTPPPQSPYTSVLVTKAKIKNMSVQSLQGWSNKIQETGER